MAMTIEDLYEQYIRPLPPAEQLRLVELISRDVSKAGKARLQQPRSLMALHGLSAEIWGGVDAQKYVEELRGEWDRRP